MILTHENYLPMEKSLSLEDMVQLGYEEDDKYYRKRMGDFGCYTVFINSISSR